MWIGLKEDCNEISQGSAQDPFKDDMTGRHNCDF